MAEGYTENGSLDFPVSLWLEILLRNGVWIKKRFSFPKGPLQNCTVNGQYDEYTVEVTHRCPTRKMFYDELAHIVPDLIPGDHLSWFRTLNKEANNDGTCLFDGAKLEINLVSSYAPCFGLCFPRPSFIRERELLNIETLFNEESAGDWMGWRRSEPSDSDRLLVNKRGREVLYFLAPPQTDFDITVSDLKMEVCNTLKIADVNRIALAAGPFYWGADFREDGLGLYSNYFKKDLVSDSRHMKTASGAALIDIIEVAAPGVTPQMMQN